MDQENRGKRDDRWGRSDHHHHRGPMSSSIFRPTSSTTHTTSSSSSGPPCPEGERCGYSREAKMDYLNSTLPQIVEESAQGKGRHLEALAQLVGCSEKEVKSFSAWMKAEHQNLFFNQSNSGIQLSNSQFLPKLESALRANSNQKALCGFEGEKVSLLQQKNSSIVQLNF